LFVDFFTILNEAADAVTN